MEEIINVYLALAIAYFREVFSNFLCGTFDHHKSAFHYSETNHTLYFNLLMLKISEWSDTLQKILQQILQDFKSVSDHFETCIKGLILS